MRNDWTTLPVLTHQIIMTQKHLFTTGTHANVLKMPVMPQQHDHKQM